MRREPERQAERGGELGAEERRSQDVQRHVGAAAGGGVDIVVRYVTRAGVRLETRNRLFGTVVELMLGAREVTAK